MELNYEKPWFQKGFSSNRTPSPITRIITPWPVLKLASSSEFCSISYKHNEFQRKQLIYIFNRIGAWWRMFCKVTSWDAKSVWLAIFQAQFVSNCIKLLLCVCLASQHGVMWLCKHRNWDIIVFLKYIAERYMRLKHESISIKMLQIQCTEFHVIVLKLNWKKEYIVWKYLCYKTFV